MKNIVRIIALLALFMAICCASLTGQLPSNIQLLANKNDFPENFYNDIWGYTDSLGKEYAVLGVRTGTAIYTLENPRDPRLVKFIPGAQSTWRDMKSFGTFIYVLADRGEDGILAINMAKAPMEITYEFHKPTINTTTLNRCHNLYIDAKGFMYLSGCNINNGGVLIFDVASSPGTPKFVSGTNSRYSHDNFSRGDTLWSADVNIGEFSVLDVSVKTAPRLMATQPTSSRFTHNCWLSDDGKFLFTTDEKAFGTVDAYDVSKLSDIRFLDKFMPRNAQANRAIPHNTHYHKGFLVTSWYTEGVIITDAHRPQNLVETGSYDTYLQTKQGFEGCWGAFPYLPSGILLASDISTGLYVLMPDYKRAAYFEGTVVDAANGVPIFGARVSAGTMEEVTDFFGAFKTGSPDSGSVKAIVSAPGFISDTFSVDLKPGQVFEKVIRLRTGTVTGANNLRLREDFRITVMPNPCPGECLASLEVPGTSGGLRLLVVNMLGQTLRQIQVPAGQKQVTLSLEPLSPGTYFLQLVAPDKTFATQRFILK
jgi:choice-of-anchor B domain-containing protein